MTTSPAHGVRTDVTVVSAAPQSNSCWAVVDTHGRALRLPASALDPRIVQLHPGQRLRASLTSEGALTDASL